MSIENNLETNVTTLTLHSNDGKHDIITKVEGRPQAEPDYCRRCGGIENLYDVTPKYEGPPDLYGCHCSWSYKT